MRVLALDQGTTSTRGIVLEADGALRPVHAVAHRQRRPAPGRVEHDPEALLANLRACLDAAGAVDAVGLANQGESCLAWDAATGEPITPVLVWLDDRAEPACARLRAAGAEPESRALSGLPLDPYFSASKLGWIMAEVPEARRLHAKGRLRLGTTDAFFLQRLTGRCVTDMATASRTGLMSLATGAWDERLCALHGVPADTLPPIAPSVGDFGAVSTPGGRAPLTASIVDQQAALWGHGKRGPGAVKITFGTGAFALAVAGSAPPTTDPAGPLPTVAWALPEGVRYALEGGVWCAGAALDWAREAGLAADPATLDPAAPPAAARGLLFVPALAGLGCPHWDRAARGAFFGLGLDTGSGDLTRAVLEGVAFRAAEVVDAFARVGRVEGAVAIDGGMAGSPAFHGFLADVLDRPVEVALQPELTAGGVASLAALGLGATLEPGRPSLRIEPRGGAARWRAVFAEARAAAAAVSRAALA